MATRSSKLENATARRRLAVRKKPYFATVAPGIALGYRRNQGAGTWSVRSTDGHGTDWVKRIALADDQEPADGTHVLNFWQAQDRARALARGKAGADDGRPLTVAEALERYEADLQSRGGDIYNARRARAHLTGALASKPVALLGATELRKWRDALTAKGLAAATVNRTRTCLRAALELASAHTTTGSPMLAHGGSASPACPIASARVMLSSTTRPCAGWSRRLMPPIASWAFWSRWRR